jgi:hypothetical protein
MYIDILIDLLMTVTLHILVLQPLIPGGKVNILGGHSIGHSKKKCLYEHVSYS